MIAWRERGTTLVAVIDGELSERTVQDIQARMENPPDGLFWNHYALDMKRARSCSLKSIKWLMGTVKMLDKREAKMEIWNANPYLKALLELTGAINIITVKAEPEQ